MNQKRTLLLFPLFVIILTTQACLVPLPDWTLFNNLDRILCTNLTGNEWVEDEDGGECISPPDSAQDQTAGEVEEPSEEIAPQGSPEAVYADPASCNAYGDASLVKIGPEKAETSYEITCEYSLEFTNTSEEQIWIFLHEHNTFMNGEEEKKWDNYLNLAPGESYQIQSDHTFRKSDKAVSSHIVDKVTLIYATDGCINTFKNNSEAKDGIAAETPILCGP